MLLLSDIICKCAVNSHCYAGDAQLRVPGKPKDLSQVLTLETCQSEVKKIDGHELSAVKC